MTHKRERQVPIRAASFLVVLFLLCICYLQSFSACAESDFADKKVRVGFFTMKNFMEGGADGTTQSGFTYELLCEISAYNHWNIEYVYDSINNLYELLVEGSIDVLPNIISTEEREEQVLLHSFPLNKERYYISSLTGVYQNGASDISILNGKKLVTVEKAFEEKIFDKWAEENNITMEKVYCHGFDEAWEIVRNGGADFILNIDNSAPNSGFESLFQVGTHDVYFAVSKTRTDLIQDINYALERIDNVSPFLISNLKQKYLNASLSSYELSSEEKNWIESHSVLRIGGLENDIPYAYKEKDGNVVGAYVELTKLIVERLRIDTLEVEWSLYPTMDELRSALKNGELDLICPEYHSYYEATKNGFAISETVMNIPMGILTLESKNSGNVHTIATGGQRPGIVYAAENFFDAEIMPLPSVDALVEAVASGEADAAIAHIYAFQDSISNDNSYKLSPLSEPCIISYAALAQNNELIMLMNRGYHLIDLAERNSLELRYATTSNRQKTVLDFIREHIVVLIFLCLIAVLVYAIIRTVSSEKLKKSLDEITRQNRIIEASKAELEAAKEAAQAASSAKTSFLFNMSHDIRTPMNAILGYTGIARKNTKEPDTGAYLAKIEVASNQLLSLVNQVLEMSRIESGKTALREQAIDIGETVENFRAVYVDQAKAKGIHLTIGAFNGENRHVTGDLDKISQIMNNLIGNALKYTHEGGSIHVRIEEEPCLEADRTTYCMTVKDTGIGMSEDFLPHLFEEFARESSSTVSQIQGTGLGMSIVKKLVDMMGGSIEVASQLGAGSSFVVRIPLKIDYGAIETKENRADSQKFSIEGLKILLVEDNEMNREIAEEILNEYGASVDTAEDGVVALEKVEQSVPGQYDVVLMDVQMPRMDGYEATRRIRSLENKELAGIKIIAMTANAFVEDKQNAIAAGMDGHLAKPIDVPTLLSTLSGIMN